MSKTNFYKIFFFVLSGFAPPEISFSQSINLGNPPVQNFPKTVFKAGTQVWDIAQDDDGLMWFGNNGGLLEFDGKHWRLHPISNRTIVRSVAVGLEKNRVFVGGQDEFGYFAPEPDGTMLYHSLKDFLPKNEHHFGDVWNVLA